MVALDDMGNVAAGRLTAAGYGAAGTTLGLPGGGETQTLTLAQLPTGISSSPSSPWAVSSNITVPGANGNVSGISGGLAAGGHVFPETSSGSWGNATLTTTGTALSTNTGGGAHPNVQPSMLATFYMKL
jgi:hypothetical protein